MRDLGGCCRDEPLHALDQAMPSEDATSNTSPQPWLERVVSLVHISFLSAENYDDNDGSMAFRSSSRRFAFVHGFALVNCLVEELWQFYGYCDTAILGIPGISGAYVTVLSCSSYFDTIPAKWDGCEESALFRTCNGRAVGGRFAIMNRTRSGQRLGKGWRRRFGEW